MPDIWQTMPDSYTITIKQNVRFQVGIYSENIKLYQIHNGRLSAIICLIFYKPCQIARPLLETKCAISGMDIL